MGNRRAYGFEIVHTTSGRTCQNDRIQHGFFSAVLFVEAQRWSKLKIDCGVCIVRHYS